jgi:hypothetical protein
LELYEIISPVQLKNYFGVLGVPSIVCLKLFQGASTSVGGKLFCRIIGLRVHKLFCYGSYSLMLT